MDALKTVGPSGTVETLPYHHYLVTLQDAATGECRSFPIGALTMENAIAGAKQDNAQADAILDGDQPHAWHALYAGQVFIEAVPEPVGGAAV